MGRERERKTFCSLFDFFVLLLSSFECFEVFSPFNRWANSPKGLEFFSCKCPIEILKTREGEKERVTRERERERERERDSGEGREEKKRSPPPSSLDEVEISSLFFVFSFSQHSLSLSAFSAFSEQRALLSYSSRSYQKLRASLRTRPKESFSGGPLSRKREAAFPFSILFSFAIVELQKKTRKRGFSFASLAPNLPSSHSFHSHNEERLKQPALL